MPNLPVTFGDYPIPARDDFQGHVMGRTTIWSQQHRTITASIAELAAIIASGCRADLLAVQLGIGRLTALLRLHLRQENDFLYPDLLESSDPAVAETARAFQAEAGELWQQYEHFIRRWPSRHVMAADFEQFRGEARVIFEAIDDRCRREDKHLLPLAQHNYGESRKLSA